MFREWGFLLGEIWVLLALAALIGLLAGWIIWGRRSTMNVAGNGNADLQGDLDACRRGRADQDAEIARLQAALSDCEASKADLVPAAVAAPVMAAPVMAEPAPAGDVEGVDYDGDGIIEGEDEGTKPMQLDAARGGKPDDLKLVKGIGPKMEKLCNKLGFYHFDQLASWTADEVAWVDANLEGFKGRVSRDEWVAQAKILAEGGTTEFAKKVEKGGMY